MCLLPLPPPQTEVAMAGTNEYDSLLRDFRCSFQRAESYRFILLYLPKSFDPTASFSKVTFQIQAHTNDRGFVLYSTLKHLFDPCKVDRTIHSTV